MLASTRHAGRNTDTNPIHCSLLLTSFCCSFYSTRARNDEPTEAAGYPSTLQYPMAFPSKINIPMASNPTNVVECSGSYNELTVFHAAPLVWRAQNGKIIQTFAFLDLDLERKILINSLKEVEDNDVKIKLQFQTATVERLGKFLACSNAQVIHFSCHGNKNFVAFEDCRGAAHLLSPADLKRLFLAGRKKLQFVFVAACYSESTGQAFIDAGVPHVLCCEKESPIMNSAAVKFSRQLYQSLAGGKTLTDSFDLAKETVRLDPSISNAEVEVQKYILLPRDRDHNVQLFFPSHRKDTDAAYSPRPTTSRLFPHLNIPHPPREMIGREADMYHLLQNLSPLGKLIKLKGGAGSGVRSIAKAAARYVSIREHSFSIDEVIWLPFWQMPEEDIFLSSLKGLSDLLKAGNDCLCKISEYDRLWTQICRCLNGKNVLIIIDSEEIQHDNFIATFLSDIFDRIGIEFVSVVLICEDGFDISGVKKCSEAEVTVGPLDFRSAALLFGRVCRFVTGGRNKKACTPFKFARLIVSKADNDLSKLDSDSKAVKLWKAIGEGLPARVHAAAKQITATQFDDLIEFAQKTESEASGMSPMFSPDANVELVNVEMVPQLQRTSASIGHSPDPSAISIPSDARSDTMPDLLSTDGESSSGDEIDEWIGVDFDSELDVEQMDWDQNILARKRKIEKQMKHLIDRFGKQETVEGDPEIKVESISGRAVVRLECEFELREDLRRKDYIRVRQMLKGIARLLKDAGATDEELENIMVGSVWKSSLNILLEAPVRVLDLFFATLKKAGTLPMENAYIVALAPTFSVKLHSSVRITKLLRSKVTNERANVLLYKVHDMALLIPMSRAAHAALIFGGIELVKVESEAGDKWESLPSVNLIFKDNAEHLSPGGATVERSGGTMSSNDSFNSVGQEISFLLNANASFQDVEENGPPAEPLQFPPPSFGRAQRVTAVVYDPVTSEEIQVPNIVYEAMPDGSAPLRGYWIDKKLKKAIYGIVRFCKVLRLRQGSTSTGPGSGAEDGSAIWELTPETAAVKIMDWNKIRELRGMHMEDPMKEVAVMQYLNQGGWNPNVLVALDVLSDEQYVYEFMPFCSNGDLFEYVQHDGRMSETVARFWFRQILNGLSHLQKMGVCHRDLSMENILVDGENNAVIIDFGLSLLVPFEKESGLRGLITPQGSCGKANYISPEVYSNAQPFDAFASDIWACGVILFIMLTGLPPFEWANRDDPRFRMITQGGLMAMLKLWKRTISEEAGDLLQRMLQEDPKDRLSLMEIMDHPWVTREDMTAPAPVSRPKESTAVAPSRKNAKEFERNVKFDKWSEAEHKSLHFMHMHTNLRRYVTGSVRHCTPEFTVFRRYVTCSF